MRIIKQKRAKNGRYGHKTYYWERLFWAIVLCGISLWFTERHFQSLPSNTITILGSTARAESIYIPSAVATPDASKQMEDFDKRVTPQGDIEERIKRAFPEDPETMVATLKAESGLNPKAIGWNCHYFRADGTRYSTSCRPGDQGKAWSVDCGIAQNNVPGKVCPEKMFDVDYSLKLAREKFDQRGFSPWYAFVTGKYKQYL